MREKLKTSFSAIDWSERRKGIPRSGPGSTLEHTESLRGALPGIFKKYEVRSFVDAPCGDWHWMKHLDLSSITYSGLDIVPELVEKNAERFGRENVAFKVADITSDPLPYADMLMCRDCLFHLKFWLRWAFLENFVTSGTPYLLTTVHDNPVNRNVPQNGKFRWFNPRVAPFFLPHPLELVWDAPRGLQTLGDIDFRSKRYMGIWHRDQISIALSNRIAS